MSALPPAGQIRAVHFENLDALRFYSFLAVFLFHSFYTADQSVGQSAIYKFIKFEVFGNGNLGVNFFFVLSGFLITHLLYSEKFKNGQWDTVSFWKRRAFRIWPLYYFCVFTGFVVFPLVKTLFGERPEETANYVYYLIFLNNFDVIRHGLPDASTLGVLWSIAVEEQFYFMWPVLLFLVPFPKHIVIFAFIILFSLVFRLIQSDPITLQFHTFSCMNDLAVGALGGWYVHRHGTKVFDNLSRHWIFVIYFMLCLIFFLFDELSSFHPFIRASGRLLVAVVFLMIIMEQNYAPNSFFKFGRNKTISDWGRISYGLYCLQFVAILTVTRTSMMLHINNSLWVVLIGETLVSLALCIFLAKLSYRILESPFLRMKTKYSKLV